MVVIVAELPAPEAADTPEEELTVLSEHLAAVALQAPLQPPTVGLSSPAPAPAPKPEKLDVRAVAADAADCAQPTARVPLSDACTRARAVSPLLPAIRPPPSNLPAAVTAISEATRDVARRRGKQPGAEGEEQKKPPSAVAIPVGSAQDEALGAGGGSAGGAAGGAGTLRVVAIHQTFSPLRPPSAFLQAPVPEHVPTGELDGPPTARPG